MIAAQIADILKSRNTFAVVSHVMPDGDSVGSMLALCSVLKRMGKNVDVYSSDNTPTVYSFLPHAETIMHCTEKIAKNYDVLIVLDCGSMDRTGECSKLESMASTSINIDHHMTNSSFADYSLVDTGASATGELIYKVIKLMGQDIFKEEAICLYTAILTDTGCFKYSNTTPETHKIAGDLINTGIDFGKIHDLIYRNYEFKIIKVLGKALISTELYSDDKIALMQLLPEDLDGHKMEDIDTNDFINYARDITPVEIAAFIKQVSPGEFKVSLRSKNNVDVRAICEKHGGGGHIRAAGCTINGSLQYVKATILKELQESLKGEDK